MQIYGCIKNDENNFDFYCNTNNKQTIKIYGARIIRQRLARRHRLHGGILLHWRYKPNKARRRLPAILPNSADILQKLMPQEKFQ